MKGRTVPRPTVRPTKWITLPCERCGHPRRVFNGRWLAYQRETARIPQRTAAALLGISGPYLSDMERNRRDVNAAMAAALLGFIKGWTSKKGAKKK